jgi:hypothetical protein
MIEPVADVVRNSAETRFLEANDAVVREREIAEGSAEAGGISSGNDAELACAAPDGIACAGEVIADGLAVETMAVVVKAGDAARDPAIEEGRPERNQPAGAGIGIALEGVTDENAAHAVADDMEGLAGRGQDEFTEAGNVFVQAAKHGKIMELANAIAESAKPPAE